MVGGEPWSVRKLMRKQEALRRFARGCPVDVERSRPARIRAGTLRSRSTGNLDYPWHACFRRPAATVRACACVRPGRLEADGRSSPSAVHQRRPRRLAVDGAPTADFSHARVNARLARPTALLRRHDDARVRSPFWRRQGVSCGAQRGHLLLGEQHARPQSGRRLEQSHADLHRRGLQQLSAVGVQAASSFARNVQSLGISSCTAVAVRCRARSGV